MAKGWHIEFLDRGGKAQVAKVGLADQDEAIEAATAGRNATNIVVLPLKDGEYEALALTEGQVLVSTRVNNNTKQRE